MHKQHSQEYMTRPCNEGLLPDRRLDKKRVGIKYLPLLFEVRNSFMAVSVSATLVFMASNVGFKCVYDLF